MTGGLYTGDDKWLMLARTARAALGILYHGNETRIEPRRTDNRVVASPPYKS